MKCEHKGCKKDAEINICHNHINEDYPPDFKNTIHNAKKEVFDDFENILRDSRHSTILNELCEVYEQLKKRHLSTFAEQKEHNSSSKKDCPNLSCMNNSSTGCKHNIRTYHNCKKRSPS